eukprot:6212362-Pleurochrysis_carterae.AAC.4
MNSAAWRGGSTHAPCRRRRPATERQSARGVRRWLALLRRPPPARCRVAPILAPASLALHPEADALAPRPPATSLQLRPAARRRAVTARLPYPPRAASGPPLPRSVPALPLQPTR